jgi:teichoic acid transport system permease protein
MIVTDVDSRVRATVAPVPRPADIPPGMQRAGARPPIPEYLRQLWARRYFIADFTRSNSQVTYAGKYLGQIWQVLTPMLNAGVYYLIFGLLLGTRRGTHNFVAFLVIGLFVFHFLQQSVTRGARSVMANQGLVRSMHFPRATLPISSTGTMFIQLSVSLLVLLPIVLLTGESPSLRWLVLPVVILLALMFALGLALIVARIGAHIPDTTALLPFVLRAWMYFSGIFYNIDVFTKHHPGWVRVVLHVNPGATYVELARWSLLSGQHLHGYEIIAALAWAFAALLGGFVFFWVAEESYARG